MRAWWPTLRQNLHSHESRKEETRAENEPGIGKQVEARKREKEDKQNGAVSWTAYAQTHTESLSGPVNKTALPDTFENNCKNKFRLFWLDQWHEGHHMVKIQMHALHCFRSPFSIFILPAMDTPHPL